MSCQCKNLKTDKVDIPITTLPDEMCITCGWKHWSQAWALARECGYADANRSRIIGEIGAAQWHIYTKAYKLAERMRDVRHYIQNFQEFVITDDVWKEISLELEEMNRELFQPKGTVFIFSNVNYPKENTLKVSSADTLVFINKAATIGYYTDHIDRMIFHRSPETRYGTPVQGVKNCYVFGDKVIKPDIPSAWRKQLDKTYDWNYPIEEGKTKSPTTGYIVVNYLAALYPNRKIVLVNFGTDVKNSTYRCPWHNWEFEAEALKKFEHVSTEN